jgi:hypothetical protein
MGIEIEEEEEVRAQGAGPIYIGAEPLFGDFGVSSFWVAAPLPLPLPSYVSELACLWLL